jgi:hypothetical protein
MRKAFTASGKLKQESQNQLNWSYAAGRIAAATAPIQADGRHSNDI